MADPAIQSINQHTQKTSLDWLYNILVQPSTGAGSGVAPAVHEQYGLSLDLLRQALVEVGNVVNVLTTTVPGKVLDARQGKVLADAIAAEIAKYAQPNGIATLGADGKIPSAQIPSIALVDVFPVASEAAMLASGAEQGDMAIRSDTSQVFILSASPASTLENWIELSALKALVDSAIADLAGAGRTTETVKKNADDIATLNGDEDAEGSVAHSIKTAVGPILADQQQTNLDLSNLKADYDLTKKQTDQRITNISAEVQKADEIYNLGSPSVLGTGTASDWNTPVVVEAKDGDMEAVLEGKTSTNVVNGANIANGASVSWDSIDGHTYYDLLNNAFITGDGTEKTATNNSGATANMLIVNLHALGLNVRLNTTAKCQAYFANYHANTLGVGEMRVKSVGKNLFDKSNVVDGYTNITGVVSGGFGVYFTTSFIPVKSGVSFTISGKTSGDAWYHLYDDKKVNLTASLVFATSTTVNPTQDGFIRISATYINMGTIQLELGSTATAYEPYRESIAYTPPIGFRLPNMVADSYNVVTGVHVKRVSDWVNVWSFATTYFFDSGSLVIMQLSVPLSAFTVFTGAFYLNSSKWKLKIGSAPTVAYEYTAYAHDSAPIYRLWLSFPTGYTATSAKAELQADLVQCRYQLATPITTQYDTQHIQAFKDGSLYINPAKRDGMVYNNGLTFDKNVLSVDTLYKFVAGEKIAITSFTITNNVVTSAQLSNGDICRAEVTFKSDQSLVPVSKTKVPYFNLSKLMDVLKGGTTGQVLKKKSAVDWDYEWVTP